MDRRIHRTGSRIAGAAALAVASCWVLVSPAPALAQILPPAPLPGGTLVVTITSPRSGATVSGTVPVSASVSIVGSLLVAGVQFRLDGSDLGPEDASPPYEISWNTTNASNASHTLTAVARDSLGARFTSDPVTITVFNDKTPPTVAITSPASGRTVSSTITVSATASDNVGVAGVQFKINGAELGPEDTTTPYTASWNTTTASNGSYTLTAVARDPTGNRATSAPVTVTVFNDTTPPTVTIASPGAGATVSASITVTASATDAGGVTVVQFLVDGVELGRDFTAPYQAAWDTRTTTDGEHTLQARAQDSAGNVGESAVIRVNVANGAGPPPPSETTRSEETNPAITYTGIWTQGDTSRAWSGGTAAVSNAASARATLSFSGTGVSWIGFRGPQTGIARVFLDGAPVEPPVDTFATTEQVQVVLFTRTGLASGTHTLAIEVTGTKNAASTDTFIVVDAFDVTGGGGAPPPSGTVRRFEETEPSLSFTPTYTRDPVGVWKQSVSHAWSGGGTAAASTAAGTQARFTFTGQSVSWIGFKGPQAGVARVSLDGGAAESLDLYSSTEEVRVPVFKRTGLANTTHTLTIDVTGVSNNPDPNSNGEAWIVVDAFDVPDPAFVRIQETPSSSIVYSSGWKQLDSGNQKWSGGTAREAETGGMQVTFTFEGTGVAWVGFTGPSGGIARVVLDGVAQPEVDTFASRPETELSRGVQAENFKSPPLASGRHTLTIEATGRQNSQSGGISIIVDAFEVTP
jgi:hypothetical protein